MDEKRENRCQDLHTLRTLHA